MDAKTVCENLLSTIRSSGLNFVLSETPFSVNIVLKKTFIYSKDLSNLHSLNSSANPLNQNQPFMEKSAKSVINKKATASNIFTKPSNSSNSDSIRPKIFKPSSAQNSCRKSVHTSQSDTTIEPKLTKLTDFNPEYVWTS